VATPLKPNSGSGAQTLLIVAACCAAISGLAFYAASRQPKPAPVAKQRIGQRTCQPQMPRIARYPTSIRGSTKVRTWVVFDQRSTFSDPKLVDIAASEVPGGRAGSIKIEQRENMPHDIGVSMRNQRTIAKGETLIAEVWLRGKPASTNQGPVIIEARIQEDGDGFRGLIDAPITLTPEFAKYEIRATPNRDYCPTDLNFALHLATGAQTIDIGPGTLKVSSDKPN
jgi:hypothetical protein